MALLYIYDPRSVDRYRTSSYPDVEEIRWYSASGSLCASVLRNFPNLTKLDCSGNCFKSLEWLEGCPQLQVLVCSNNRLTTLTGIQNCKELRELYCSYCSLVSLQGLEACTRLEVLKCVCNQLESLVDIRYCSQLKVLECRANRLASLVGLEGCTQLQVIDCAVNNLRTLEGLENCSQLLDLSCYHNQLTALDHIKYCTHLLKLSCHHNRLESIECLVYLMQLHGIWYHDNPIGILSIQAQRFMNRIQNTNTNHSVYTNKQNVHDIHIQKCVCESIQRLLTDPKPEFSIQAIIESDLPEHAVRLLLEYCSDDAIHSVHLLTYLELLGYVWARIQRSEHRIELVKILAEQVTDAECKCFTGRFNRTISVLVGFYPDIIIEIADSSRIGAIILAVKERLDSYTLEEHVRQAENLLLEADYDTATIKPWLDAIMED